MPRQISGLEDPLAWICLTWGRRHSLGTGTRQFQTEFRRTVLLHHPNSVEALETLNRSKLYPEELFMILSAKWTDL
jgi:hypothetical protein